jgi:hypothetical protein
VFTKNGKPTDKFIAPTLSGGEEIEFSTFKVSPPGYAIFSATGQYAAFAPDGKYGSIEECMNCASKDGSLFLNPRSGIKLHYVYCGHRLCEKCNPGESLISTTCQLCRQGFGSALNDTVTKYFDNNQGKVIAVEQISSKAKVDDDPDVSEEEDSVDTVLEDLPVSAKVMAQQLREKEITNISNRLKIILESATDLK